MAHESVFILIISIDTRCFASKTPHLSCDKHSNWKATLLNHKCLPQITTKLALGRSCTEVQPAALTHKEGKGNDTLRTLFHEALKIPNAVCPMGLVCLT